MARKSLVQRVLVESTKAAHDCRANKRHRLHKGDPRLKVFVGRSAVHYCQACAVKIVEHDIEKLQDIARQLAEGSDDA